MAFMKAEQAMMGTMMGWFINSHGVSFEIGASVEGELPLVSAGDITAERTVTVDGRPKVPSMGWERYCGLTKVDVVRRPIEQIVREKELAHLSEMLGQRAVTGMNWAQAPDYAGTDSVEDCEDAVGDVVNDEEEDTDDADGD